MKTYIKLLIGILIVFIFGIACSNEEMSFDNPYQDVSDYLQKLPAYSQRSGNSELGKSYLFYGDYVDSGIPVELFSATLGAMTEARNELNRDGVNADIPFSFNQIKASNGANVVVPNCMQCHAGYVDGEFVFGLGNNMFDNTIDQGAVTPFLDNIVKSSFGELSPEYEAFKPFARALTATKGQLVTEVVGANSADKLAVVLAAHRNKDDLTWSDEPLSDIPEEVIPADVPAWWLLKKKNAMFSTGIGRKDFARLMMASSILTMQDSSRAREVDDQFGDVLSYINSLESPKYPGSVDADMASKGKEIFDDTCAKCHGTYGDNPSYPNFLVSHELLETDPALAMSNYAYSGFTEWYNDSWFSKGENGAMVVPTDGYVAPPLDGVWATAPYLHNGSVPTLEDLLNSPQRPEYWRKSLEDKNYDHKKLGLKYSVETIKKDRWTYDTFIKGYGHTGHYFADHLASKDRLSLLEYLKTL